MSYDPFDVRPQLKQAYQLIKEGQKAEAYEMLQTLLEQVPETVDGWWLAANAAPDNETGILACKQVLLLKPDHAAAQQLLARLVEMRRTAELTPETLKQSRRIPAPHQPRRIGTWLAIGLTFSLIVVGVFLFVSYFLGGYDITTVINKIRPQPPVQTVGKGTIVVPTAPPGGLKQTVNLSQPVQLTSAVAISAQNDYVFSGNQGETFLATITFPALQGDARKSLTLLGPDGQPTASSYQNFSSKTTAMLQYTLPSNGFYTLRIEGAAGVAQGAYVLELGLSAP